MTNIVRVASFASWPGRLTVLTHDPYLWLADGLAGSGPRRWLALVTVSLWLTPALYAAYLRDGGTRLGRSAMWTAAGLWLGTMTLMGLPFTALLEAPLARLGHLIGYWDDQFAAPIIAAVLTVLSFSLLLLIAALEWALIWVACGVDALIGDRTISPPPFGYVAIKVAGAIAGVAALTSALLFAIKPLNDPVWRWIDTVGLVQTILIFGLGSAVMLGFSRKTRITQSCGEQIYGGRAKAIAYQLGVPVVLLTVVWAFIRSHLGHP